MTRPLRLGDLQIAILRVLWDEGEATVARVTEALAGKRRAPTTIATMLSKLERRGIVAHRVEGRQFVYRAHVSEQEVVTESEYTGPGIAPEIADSLFEAFATHGKPHGTGLGLSISKKIVEDHHGRISVRNQPGRGAVFSFTLPRQP